MWKGATDALNAIPVRISARPVTSSGSCVFPSGDLVEAELPGCAVDQRRPEQEDRRAEAPDDQVLEACLQRLRAGSCRARRGRRARSRTTPARGTASSGSRPGRRRPCRRPPRRAARSTRPRGPGAWRPTRSGRDRSGAGDHDLRQRCPAVAGHRVGDQCGRVGAPVVDEGREDPGGRRSLRP